MKPITDHCADSALRHPRLRARSAGSHLRSLPARVTALAVFLGLLAPVAQADWYGEWHCPNGTLSATPAGCNAAATPPAYNPYYYQQQMRMRQRMIQQQQYQQQQQLLRQQQALQQQEQEQQQQEELKRQQEAARKAQFLMDRNATAADLKGGFDTTGAGLKGLKTGNDRSGLKTGHDTDYGPDVVHATHVTSGLPQFIEDALPHTPAGDRLRKGYEAVLHHDWKVALAWFQDAHNHDPHNLGIDRLVDLAQFTLQEESKNPGYAATPLPAQVNDFNHGYLDQHPALEQGLPKQYFAPPPAASAQPPAEAEQNGLRHVYELWKAGALFQKPPRVPAVAAVRD